MQWLFVVVMEIAKHNMEVRMLSVLMDFFGVKVPFVSIVLMVSFAYFILILCIFCICNKIQPQKFLQSTNSQKTEIDTMQAAAAGVPSFSDCSAILKCCPCEDFSLRQFLKSCCCDSEKFRRSVNCECIRPAIHGSQGTEGLSLVCCQICGTN